jgi:hypothetical protein
MLFIEKVLNINAQHQVKAAARLTVSNIRVSEPLALNALLGNQLNSWIVLTNTTLILQTRV